MQTIMLKMESFAPPAHLELLRLRVKLSTAWQLIRRLSKKMQEDKTMKAVDLPQILNLLKSTKVQRWGAQFQQFQLCGEEIGPRCAAIPQMTSTAFQGHRQWTLARTGGARWSCSLHLLTERKGWWSPLQCEEAVNKRTHATTHTRSDY